MTKLSPAYRTRFNRSENLRAASVAVTRWLMRGEYQKIRFSGSSLRKANDLPGHVKLPWNRSGLLSRQRSVQDDLLGPALGPGALTVIVQQVGPDRHHRRLFALDRIPPDEVSRAERDPARPLAHRRLEDLEERDVVPPEARVVVEAGLQRPVVV